MKIFLFISGFILFAFHGFTQLSGTVIDASSKEKIPGAVVEIENSFFVTVTDAEGKLFFQGLKEKHVRLKISHIGYESLFIETDLPKENFEIALTQKTYL